MVSQDCKTRIAKTIPTANAIADAQQVQRHANRHRVEAVIIKKEINFSCGGTSGKPQLGTIADELSISIQCRYQLRFTQLTENPVSVGCSIVVLIAVG
jgi:hypothetical protein